MLRESVISEVASKQKANVARRSPGLDRLSRIRDAPKGFVHVVTGVRRCGKSTLMEQRMRLRMDDAFYLNFESAALAGIDLKDARRLDSAIDSTGARALFFDEIQQMKGWEQYIRTKLDEGFSIVVTGSNASLLGMELGTKLTGRHVDSELFPFDYAEFLAFTKMKANARSTEEYLRRGGFPAFLATGDDRLLETLFEDIVIRDVAVRYGIREIEALRRLAAYLVDNIGGRMSAAKLRQPLSIASSSTILKWCDCFSEAYLFDFIPKFSPSVKVQIANPRKVYCIDTGLQHVMSATPAPDDARNFENLVYLALRRACRTIHYYDDGQGECDFIPFAGKRAGFPVQATVVLNSDNEERECAGIRSAMRTLRRRRGWIVTRADEDEIEFDEGVVKVTPFFKFNPKEAVGRA